MKIRRGRYDMLMRRIIGTFLAVVAFWAWYGFAEAQA